MPRKFTRAALDAARGVKRYIDHDPLKRVSSSTLAQRANVSRNCLETAFKERFGTTIGKYKIKVRMKLAQHQLRTGKSIKEITIMMRYSSPSAFSTAFRKHYQLSPSLWLKRDKESNVNKQGNL